MEIREKPATLLPFYGIRYPEVAIELRQRQDDQAPEPGNRIDRVVKQRPGRKVQQEYEYQVADGVYRIDQRNLTRPTRYESPVGEEGKRVQNSQALDQ